MYKTAVYTLVNGNIDGLTHWKHARLEPSFGCYWMHLSTK